MLFPTTLTDRLIIREFTPTDRPALNGFVRDPSQLQYMLFSMATAAEADGSLTMAREAAAAEPRLEYHLAVEARPVAAEASAAASWALIDFAFGVLRLHRVWGMCHSLNAASARVMTKLGMVHEGTLREHRVLRGAYRSSQIFGILENEWPSGTRSH